LNVPLSPVLEQKEFKFDNSRSSKVSDEGYVERPEEIQIDEDDAIDIDLLARDLKVNIVFV
jgi:hypothetical protein